MRAFTKLLETIFETFLFNSRLIVILAVIGSLTSSVLMFVRGAILIVHSAKDFFHHWKDPHGDDLSIALISSVDSFLFATVLLIFAMGIYELFISKIDPASRHADSRPNWLQIHSLDDLKGAVGKVILMILIVRLFESAVKMKYDHPLHLLYLGLAILFVAASLYLQHLAHKHEKPHGDSAHAEDHFPPSEEGHAKDDHAVIAPAPLATIPQPIPVQPRPEPPPPAPPPYVPPYNAPLPFASQPPQPPMQQHPGSPMSGGAQMQPMQPPMQTMQSPYGPAQGPSQPPQQQPPQGWPPNGGNGPRRGW